MTIKEWVEDLVTEYFKECNLTPKELTAIVLKSDWDKELNYEIETAIYTYINEFLWDIGKPTKEFEDKTTKLENDYIKWCVSHNATTGIESVSKFMDEIKYGYSDRYLVGSILRGRDKGELREQRLDISGIR